MLNSTQIDCKHQADCAHTEHDQREPLTADTGALYAPRQAAEATPATAAPYYRRRAARIAHTELLLKLKYGDEESETRRIRTLIVANCTGELRDVNAELLDLSIQLDALKDEDEALRQTPFDLAVSTDWTTRQFNAQRAYYRALYRKWTTGF
jgi:hypothetical protein